MFDNLGQMMNLMKKAGEIKNNLGKMKETLAKNEFSASCGGDAVQVFVTGDLQVKKVLITDAALANREELEEMILSATNNALMTAKVAAQEEVKKLTGGIDIPGLF